MAWLLTTARRKAVDRLRRDKAYAARLAIMQLLRKLGRTTEAATAYRAALELATNERTYLSRRLAEL